MPFFNNIFPPEVITYVSSRPHDFLLPPDQNDISQEKKRFLSEQAGVRGTTFVNIRQVHGDRVIVIPKSKPYVFSPVLEESDGIITSAANLPIVIRTADCVPAFVYDREQKQIGLFHAGWKGTQKQILLKGLRRMRANPEEIAIGFGPAIRQCCYEIGPDVWEYFPDGAVERNGNRYLDLVNENIKQALDFGVLKQNISDCGICTCCNEKYFSYRREGEQAGRNISLMMLKG